VTPSKQFKTSRERRCFVESQTTSTGSSFPAVTPVFIPNSHSQDNTMDVKSLIGELRNEVEVVDEVVGFILNQLINMEEYKASKENYVDLQQKTKEKREILVLLSSNKIEQSH